MMCFYALRCGFVLLTMIGAIANYASGQTAIVSNEVIGDRKITMDRRSVSLRAIFEDLIEKYDVPIGLEESADEANRTDLRFGVVKRLPLDCDVPVVGDPIPCQSRRLLPPSMGKKFTIQVNDAKLSTVLDAIVQQMGEYRWTIADQVVNITPTGKRSKLIEEFLELKITKFEVAPTTSFGRSVNDLRHAILTNPDALRFYEANNLQFAGTIVQSKDGFVPLPSGLDDLPAMNVRDLLNRLTRLKRGGWSIRIDKRSKYTVIDLEI